MSTHARPDLEQAVFRANPACELVPWERLGESQRTALADQMHDDELFGVLCPRNGPGAVKAVSCDVALLFFALASPGPLPRFARGARHGPTSEHVEQLVLDGILEVELDGQFVGGARAFQRLHGERAIAAPKGAIAKLSTRAVVLAHGLVDADVVTTFWSLYSYNRAPRTPRRAREWSDADAFERNCGLREAAVAATLAREWSRLSPSEAPTAWRAWVSKRPAHGGTRAGAPVYKLYISPALEDFHDAFARALAVLTEHGVHQFKFGADLAGLLRPDKFVAYFASLEELNLVAQRMRAALAGCRAQGVPFTAAVDDDGLLSWGIDPPSANGGASPARESWRMWVTQRLAASLIEAKHAEAGSLAPWEFALERLRLEGVDICGWEPSLRTWLAGRNLRS